MKPGVHEEERRIESSDSPTSGVPTTLQPLEELHCSENEMNALSLAPHPGCLGGGDAGGAKMGLQCSQACKPVVADGKIWCTRGGGNGGAEMLAIYPLVVPFDGSCSAPLSCTMAILVVAERWT